MENEGAKITYAPTSPLSNPNHPLRESFGSAVETKLKAAKEVKEKT
jgi:hypothetical protein